MKPREKTIFHENIMNLHIIKSVELNNRSMAGVYVWILREKSMNT